MEEFTNQKLLGMTDDTTKNKALFIKVDKRNETLGVSLSYGRGFSETKLLVPSAALQTSSALGTKGQGASGHDGRE